MKHPTFSDNIDVLSAYVKTAHTPFFDELPANAQARAPVAPADATMAREVRGSLLRRLIDALARWSDRQRLDERERYLARATDIFGVEARIRDLERRPLRALY